MKISDWPLGYYKERFDPDGTKEFVVLKHDRGSTWNDGGRWYKTIVRCNDEILEIYMPTDYRSDDLKITKMKVSLREVYEPL